MYRMGRIFIVLCMFCMGTVCCGRKEQYNTFQPETKESQVLKQEEREFKDDCVLCGNGKGTMVSMYRGQKNLGIISLNTFDIAYIGINQYSDEGKLIERPAEQSSTSTRTSREGGYSSMVSENPDRGFATGSVTFYQSASLDLEKISKHLCPDCINSILEACWDENPYGVGLIDFSEKKIRLFEKNISGFMFGDYYVSCNYRRREEEDYQDMDFLIFYCPERYK